MEFPSHFVTFSIFLMKRVSVLLNLSILLPAALYVSDSIDQYPIGLNRISILGLLYCGKSLLFSILAPPSYAITLNEIDDLFATAMLYRVKRHNLNFKILQLQIKKSSYIHTAYLFFFICLCVSLSILDILQLFHKYSICVTVHLCNNFIVCLFSQTSQVIIDLIIASNILIFICNSPPHLFSFIAALISPNRFSYHSFTYYYEIKI